DINEFFVILLTFGVIGGATVGFVIGYVSTKQKKKKPSAIGQGKDDIYQPSNIYKRNREYPPSQLNKHQFDDLPHTINDFYKKQK
ncbi:MAG: hypothetical protein KGY50_01540, partial [Candidatus Thermoplasmatota archaeon]|nr:hypothetical protein [Candidatus Thermoplasmatota archaeon]